MKIKILGSNGWYSTKLGNTTCVLIEAKDYYIVLDAGDGIHKLDEHINTDKPIYLFLSHFHLDHIYGFHIFPKFEFKQPIKIFGQPGTKEFLNKIIINPYAMPFKEIEIKTEIKDLEEGLNELPDIPFLLECRYLNHVDPCFGYRFNIEGKVIAYCTDTGFCDNLLHLSKNADILFTECGLGPGEQPHKDWPHLNPEIAAETAKRANIDKLLLMHFGPYSYRTEQDKKEAEKVAKKIFPNTTICYDDLEIKL